MTGIVGSSPERAAAKAKAENLPDPYPSFEAMLDDPRVDVVHLATPNHLHDEQVRAVLDAGKHVVCEKPLAMTSTQTARAARARRRRAGSSTPSTSTSASTRRTCTRGR